MSKSFNYVGVDVSKSYLDASFNRRLKRFENSPAGFKSLRAYLLTLCDASGKPPRVICEASGGYQLPMMLALAG